MPMVPNFQGNLPQVSDTTSSGAVPVQIPQSNFSYERVMQRAMQPINAAADTAIKMMEIERNRVIKAESDDAERQVMEAINTALNDPDTGYMTKQGRNAMDAYKPTMDDLTRNVNKIVGGLSPQAREAVKSRIDDRMMTAANQAQRWNSQQTRSYQVNSSQARIDSMQKDAAMHYADPSYLKKTQASIDQEVDYLGALAGWDAQTISNMKSAQLDALQASRFSTWAQDDPLSALEALQMTGKGAMSADIRAKLTSQLWGMAKPQLSLLLSDKLGKTMLDKKDFLKQATKPGFSTGIPVIDRLTVPKKLELLTSAYSASATKRAEAQSSLVVDVRNSIATAADTGSDPNVLSEDRFIEAYGEDDGKKKFEAYMIDFNAAGDSYTMQFMSNDQIKQIIDSYRPSPGDPDYAQQKQAQESLKKAAQTILKARKADPIGCAIATEQFGMKPLNFNNTSELTSQLRNRVAVSDDMFGGWGLQKVLFSTAEASMLTEILDKSPIENRVGLLKTIADAIGEQGVAIVSNQFSKENRKYSVSLAGFNITNGGGMSVGEKYLRGVEAIEQKRVRIDPKEEVGAIASFYKTLGDDPEEGVDGLFASPEAAKATVELARGVYAFNALSGQSSDYEEALNAAVGGEVQAFNGKKIVLPRGVDSSAVFNPDITDALSAQARFVQKGKGVYYAGGIAITAKELAEKMPKMTLQTKNVNQDGSVTYSLIYNGVPIYGPDGSLYVFDLSKDMIEANKRRESEVEAGKTEGNVETLYPGE